MKYVEILNDLELINTDFYDQVKYGTTDKRIITLLKNGISLDLAKILLQDRYTSFVSVNIETDTVNVLHGIEEAMIEYGDNRILSFEVKFHIT